MAYFRCGGSGIPASLKSGMNSVLNKKFGTSTTYDPSGWPSDVNLLGPLPVKSASGAIASFSDGADDVPVKSCVVSFTPSGGGGTPSSPVAITGVSGITLTNKDNMSTPTHTDTYTDTFGQTIYGGSRDLVTDKASVKGFKNVFNVVSETVIDSECYNFNKVNGNVAVVGDVVRITFNTKTVSNVNRISNTYNFVGCNVAPHSFSYASDTEHFYINTVFYLFIDKTICGTTSESVFNWLVSLNTNGTPLEVYMEYTTSPELTGLTPHEIDTLLGDNNFYADTGDTSVEYRADIDLALNA